MRQQWPQYWYQFLYWFWCWRASISILHNRGSFQYKYDVSPVKIFHYKDRNCLISIPRKTVFISKRATKPTYEIDWPSDHICHDGSQRVFAQWPRCLLMGTPVSTMHEDVCLRGRVHILAITMIMLCRLPSGYWSRVMVICLDTYMDIP